MDAIAAQIRIACHFKRDIATGRDIAGKNIPGCARAAFKLIYIIRVAYADTFGHIRGREAVAFAPGAAIHAKRQDVFVIPFH